MDTAIAILSLALLMTTFYLGVHFGSSAEKEVVGKALAEYGKISAEAAGLVENVLSRLEKAYTYYYDEAAAELERIKKAL